MKNMIQKSNIKTKQKNKKPVYKYISIEKAMEQVRAMKNTDINAEDRRIAYEIYGRCNDISI